MRREDAHEWQSESSKKMVLAYFKVLSRHSSGETEEN